LGEATTSISYNHTAEDLNTKLVQVGLTSTFYTITYTREDVNIKLAGWGEAKLLTFTEPHKKISSRHRIRGKQADTCSQRKIV
jgi:hypothetical protein